MTAIDDKYASLPDAGRMFGDPITAECVAANRGRYRRYEHGMILWHADVGAHEVHGHIAQKYGITGCEKGPLGYPTSDESDAVGGRFSHFQNGSIYWRPDLGAQEVHGAIWAVWAEQGYERGTLGYPVSDETRSLMDSVRWNRFEHGLLCWDPSNADLGVYPVTPVDSVLLIVAPRGFRAALRPLVTHKRDTGMPTIVLDIEAVAGAGIGRDDAEGIKRVAWEAWDSLQVKYLLLVGDASRVPVRYRYTSGVVDWTDSWYTCADLYYGALTRGHTVTAGSIQPDASRDFDDWDANHDNHYDEHHWSPDISRYNPDRVDGCPDLAVGRVPAHTAEQVAVYVDKVIRYERGEARPPAAQGRLEVLVDFKYDSDGLLATGLSQHAGPDLHARYVAVNLAPSEPLPTIAGVPAADWSRASRTSAADAAGRSAWLAWVGHGSATSWNITDGDAPINVDTVAGYSNRDALPIVYAAGCLTGAFVHNPPNTGPYRGADGQMHNFSWAGTCIEPVHGRIEWDRVWDHGDVYREYQAADGSWVHITPPSPAEYDLPDATDASFAGAWLFNPNGGAIAYFGEQTVAQDTWAIDLGAGMLTQFGGYRVLGDMWLYGQQQYWARYRASDDAIGASRIYLGYMTLFGDPSLRLGTPDS